MTEECDATTAQTTNQGPTLLRERPLLGIFVHLLGLGTFAFGPALVYLVADHEFTRRNARNATNWQLLVLVVNVASIFGMFGALVVANLPIADVVAVPDPLATAGGLGLAIGAVAVIGGLSTLLLVNVVFALIATGKAIFGDAWAYPVAPDVVGWTGARMAGRTPWPLALIGYALATPITAVSFVPPLLGYGAVIPITALLTIALMGAAVLATAALVRDAQDLAETNAAWRPSWLPFVGPPVVAGVGVFLLAEPVWSSANASGDAIYAFMLVLWLTTVAYLLLRHRRVEYR